MKLSRLILLLVVSFWAPGLVQFLAPKMGASKSSTKKTTATKTLSTINKVMTDRKEFLRTAAIATASVEITGGVATSKLASGGSTLSKTASMAPPFHHHDVYQPPLQSLVGQVHVITGATTGLGLESAKRLALAGATVVLTARTSTKGERAKADVLSNLEEHGVTAKDQAMEDRVHYLTLDLDHFDSIRSFPQRFQELMGADKSQIAVLMNNAGLELDTRQITTEGFEKTFQSNHLGPFLLTALLFPLLRRDQGGARVINVSSMAHQFALTPNGKPGLDLDNLNGEHYKDWGSGWPAYGATKLENILFTQELQRRAGEAGLSWLTTVSLHPGVVGTDIWRNSYVGTQSQPAVSESTGNWNTQLSPKRLASSLFHQTVLSTEEGANTQVWLASTAQQDLSKAAFYDEHGVVKPLERYAQDPMQAQELWKVSETLANTKFKVQ